MLKENIKIGIIIPVYNAELYLNQCVDSVINQTYKNIEVILVDDGSTDNSPIICDEYAERDSRVKVLHNKNSGVSSARNAGLKIVSGDYVTFVDSDDWLDLNTLEACVNAIDKRPEVGCVTFSYVKEHASKTTEKHIFDGDKEFLSKDSFSDGFYRRIFGLLNSELKNPEKLEILTTCWGKLYRRDLALQGEFVDIKKVGSCEDGIYNILALKNCNTAVYLDKCFYHYRYVKGSITTKYRPDLIPQWSNLFAIMQNEIDKNGFSEDFQESLNNRIALSILGIGMNALANENFGFREFCRYIKGYLKSDMYSIAIKTMQIHKLPVTWGALLFCCKCRMSFFASVILNIIKKIV